MRAWDKENKCFLYGDSLHLDLDGKIIRGGVDWTDRYIINKEPGLKDKNGKKIFENDIVRISITPSIEDPLITHGYFQVVFHDGSYCLDFLGDGLFPLSEYIHQDCEVIGNLYQHPELLTPQNG